jgi:hypothetical protein
MRQSTASTRPSHAPGSQPPSAALLARLADKKKEFEAVDALQRASALFLRRLEGLADDCEVMAEAGIGASHLSHCLLLRSLICGAGPRRRCHRRGAFFDCSAWSGARAVAADVPYPGYVPYVSILCFRSRR